MELITRETDTYQLHRQQANTYNTYNIVSEIFKESNWIYHKYTSNQYVYLYIILCVALEYNVLKELINCY